MGVSFSTGSPKAKNAQRVLDFDVDITADSVASFTSSMDAVKTTLSIMEAVTNPIMCPVPMLNTTS